MKRVEDQILPSAARAEAAGTVTDAGDLDDLPELGLSDDVFAEGAATEAPPLEEADEAEEAPEASAEVEVEEAPEAEAVGGGRRSPPSAPSPCCPTSEKAVQELALPLRHEDIIRQQIRSTRTSTPRSSPG